MNQSSDRRTAENTPQTADDQRLVEGIRAAETPEERRVAVQALAKRSVNRQRGTYDTLAHG